MSKKQETGQLKITQIKSPIGYHQRTWRVLEALGLKRMHHTVVQPDNAAIRGMIKAIPHLLKVEEVEK